MMTNLDMLLNEICGMQELSHYMDANFPAGWGDYELQEETENNLEFILEFLGISWRSWSEAVAGLQGDDLDSSWYYDPNDDYLYCPPDWELY